MDASHDDEAELDSFLRTLVPVHNQQAQQSTTSPLLDRNSPSSAVGVSAFHPNQQHSPSQSQQASSAFGFLAPNAYQFAQNQQSAQHQAQGQGQGQAQSQAWWGAAPSSASVDGPAAGREGFVPRPGFTMEEYANLISERIQSISRNSNQSESHQTHAHRSSLSAPGDYREAGSGYATPSYASSYGSYQDDHSAFDGASSNGDHTFDSGFNLNGDDQDSKGDVANADFFSSFDNFNCQSLAPDPAELDVPLVSDSDNHQPGWPFNRSLNEYSIASHLSNNLHLSGPKRTSTMETDATICPDPPAPQLRVAPVHQSSLPSSHLSSFDFSSNTLSPTLPEALSEEPDEWPESPKGMSEKSFFEGEISSVFPKSGYGQQIPSPQLVSGQSSRQPSPFLSHNHKSNTASSSQNASNYDARPKLSVSPAPNTASASASSSPSQFDVQHLSRSNHTPPPISLTTSQSPSSTSSPLNSNHWSSPILQSPSETFNLSPIEPNGQLYRNPAIDPSTNSRMANFGQMPSPGGSQSPGDPLQINIVLSPPMTRPPESKMPALNEFASSISGGGRSPVHGSSSTSSSPGARMSPTVQDVSSQALLVSSSRVQPPGSFGLLDRHTSTSPTSPIPKTSPFFSQSVSLSSDGTDGMNWLSSPADLVAEPSLPQSQITISPPQNDPSALGSSQGNPPSSLNPYPGFPDFSLQERLDLSSRLNPAKSVLPGPNQISPFLKAPPQRQRSRSEASLIPYDFGPVPIPPTMNPNHLAKSGSSQSPMSLSASPTQQQQENQLLFLQQQIQFQLQQQRQQQQQQQQQQQLQQQQSHQFQFQIQPPQSDVQNANTASTSSAGSLFPPLDAFQNLQMQQQMQRVNFFQSSPQPTTSSSSSSLTSSVHHQSSDGKPRRTSFGGGTFGAGTPNYGQGLLNPWTGASELPSGEHASLGMPGPGVQRSLSDAGSNRFSHRKVKSVDINSSPYLGVPTNSSRSPRHRSPSRPNTANSPSSTLSASNSNQDLTSLPNSTFGGSVSPSGLSPTQDLVQMDMNMFDSDDEDGDAHPEGPSIVLTPLSDISASGGLGGQEELNVRKQSVTTNKTANASKSRRKVDAHFVCPIPGCGTTFTRSFNLRGHLRSHTDERPFKCETCGKGFARQHDCKRHMALHVGYRPHSCMGCKKKFARLDALSRHLKSDAGQECLRIAGTSAIASDTDPEADVEEKSEKVDSSGESGSRSPPPERDIRMPTRGMSGVLL